jgi:uncharacterized membrane protein YqgA involved in biofilm formation
MKLFRGKPRGAQSLMAANLTLKIRPRLLKKMQNTVCQTMGTFRLTLALHLALSIANFSLYLCTYLLSLLFKIFGAYILFVFCLFNIQDWVSKSMDESRCEVLYKRQNLLTKMSYCFIVAKRITQS